MPSLHPTDVPEGVAPGELVSKFLTMMWETAETNAGADKKEMVVAVPHGASEEYKEALKAACTTAGVGVTAFISEPLAVAVGYEGLASPADGNILVYDLGASKVRAPEWRMDPFPFPLRLHHHRRRRRRNHMSTHTHTNAVRTAQRRRWACPCASLPRPGHYGPSKAPKLFSSSGTEVQVVLLTLVSCRPCTLPRRAPRATTGYGDDTQGHLGLLQRAWVGGGHQAGGTYFDLNV